MGLPEGGLWMSLVLRPELSASLAPRITQTAAVGVAKALWGFGVEARIKWPNDLLVAQPGEPWGRKICGILAESSSEKVPVPAKRVGPAGASGGDRGERRLDFVILGVGLNANLDPGDLQVPDREVTTLREELGRDLDLPELLDALLSSLDAELGRIQDFSSVLDNWRALNCTLGNAVRVQRFGEVLEGRAVDLTPEGALLLQTANGTIEVFEGEVEHLRRGEA